MTLPPERGPDLAQAIALGYERRDRANMAPTIAYFQRLLDGDPDHPLLVFELAGAYDSDGQEQRARALYERALSLGLAGDPLRRCLCQYGSTLRWLGQLDDSTTVLKRARATFPDSDAARVFLALTLHETGDEDDAIAELLTVITDHSEATDLGHYATGLAGLAQWFASGRPDD